jgi:hypothetical protein
MNVPADRPLDAFLLRLHDEGIDIHQAMWLCDQGIPEEELRKPPQWARISLLIARHVSDVRWRADERERTGHTEAADDYADQYDHWNRQLGEGFLELQPGEQIERLRGRKHEAVNRRELPETMRRHPFAKGYAGPPLNHTPTEHRHWEIDEKARRDHAAIDER